MYVGPRLFLKGTAFKRRWRLRSVKFLARASPLFSYLHSLNLDNLENPI